MNDKTEHSIQTMPVKQGLSNTAQWEDLAVSHHIITLCKQLLDM
jgi:hypothetical protein